MEAAALTPRLFYGDDLSLPHEYVYGDASTLVRAGKTVRVDSDEWALISLLNLGLSLSEAQERIDHAKVGLPDPDTALSTWSEDGPGQEAEDQLEGRDG